MTARILYLTPATREAVLDMRCVQKAIREKGRGYCPALAKAIEIVIAHARGDDPRPKLLLADEPDGA